MYFLYIYVTYVTLINKINNSVIVIVSDLPVNIWTTIWADDHFISSYQTTMNAIFGDGVDSVNMVRYIIKILSSNIFWALEEFYTVVNTDVNNNYFNDFYLIKKYYLAVARVDVLDGSRSCRLCSVVVSVEAELLFELWPLALLH